MANKEKTRTELFFEDLSAAYRKAVKRLEDINTDLTAKQKSGEYSTRKLQEFSTLAKTERAEILSGFANQAQEIRNDLETHLNVVNSFGTPDPALLSMLSIPAIVNGLTESEWASLANKYKTYTSARVIQMTAKDAGFYVDVKSTQQTLDHFNNAKDRLYRDLLEPDAMKRPDPTMSDALYYCGAAAGLSQSSYTVQRIPKDLTEAIALDREAEQAAANAEREEIFIEAGFTGKTPSEVLYDRVIETQEAQKEVAQIREERAEREKAEAQEAADKAKNLY